MIAFIKVFHVLSLLTLAVLIGFAFAGAISPSLREKRRLILMAAGVTSVVVLLSGFSLLGMLKYGMPLWAIVKAFCWLILSGLAGMAFRKPEKIKEFTLIAGATALTALIMVFFQPHF